MNKIVLNEIIQAPIVAFDELIKNSINPFVQVSARIGDEVKLMVCKSHTLHDNSKKMSLSFELVIKTH